MGTLVFQFSFFIFDTHTHTSTMYCDHVQLPPKPSFIYSLSHQCPFSPLVLSHPWLITLSFLFYFLGPIQEVTAPMCSQSQWSCHIQAIVPYHTPSPVVLSIPSSLSIGPWRSWCLCPGAQRSAIAYFQDFGQLWVLTLTIFHCWSLLRLSAVFIYGKVHFGIWYESVLLPSKDGPVVCGSWTSHAFPLP